MNTITTIQQIASPALDIIFLAVTFLGNPEAYIAMLTVLYLAINADLGRRAGVYLLISAFLNGFLKGIAQTPRPFEVDPRVAQSDMAVDTAGGASFPSGHAQMSATFWGYLGQQVRVPWFWALTAVLIILISLSRLYLGLHWPFDVWAGLGVAGLVVIFAVLSDRFIVPWLTKWPTSVLFVLGLLVPFALHLLLDVSDSALQLGALAGFLTAPMLVVHTVPTTWWRRLILGAGGLVIVGVLFLCSGVLLPETVKEHDVGGFLRYLGVAYVGLALVPWLAQRAGLASTPAATSTKDGLA